MLQPLFLLVSGFVAVLFLIQDKLLRLLCRVEYAGKENLEHIPNQIFCIWHENLPLFFLAHQRWRKPNIWLTFPLWYMKPIHILKKMIGIKELAYGASGHEGKAALEKVLNRLNQGWSTFLTPDGPFGPLKVVKDGVLLMSLKTGTPVVPVRFYLTREWRIPSWDRKRYPAFFSTLVVEYGQPVVVREGNFEVTRNQIAVAMNDPLVRPKGSKRRPYL